MQCNLTVRVKAGAFYRGGESTRKLLFLMKPCLVCLLLVIYQRGLMQFGMKGIFAVKPLCFLYY